MNETPTMEYRELPESPAGTDATVIITTKDRHDEVVFAVESAVAQTARVEVIVVDDGSSDDTSRIVSDRFPAVRVFRSGESRGLITQRNFAADVARGRVLFTLDDDAVFTSDDTVSRVLGEFDDDRIGAVTVPMVNVPDTRVLLRAPSSSETFVTFTFKGGANAIRADVFRALGGYRPILRRQGEESDFAIRMLQRGLFVRLGDSAPIEHRPSPTRNIDEIIFFERRNDVLFGWLNVPGRNLAPYFARQLAETAWRAFQTRRLKAPFRGMADGIRVAHANRTDRQPVSRDAYRLSRRLVKAGELPLSDLK